MATPKPKPKKSAPKSKTHESSVVDANVEVTTETATSHLERRLLGISRARAELDKKKTEIRELLSGSNTYANVIGGEGDSSVKKVKFNKSALDSEESDKIVFSDDEVEDSENPEEKKNKDDEEEAATRNKDKEFLW